MSRRSIPRLLAISDLSADLDPDSSLDAALRSWIDRLMKTGIDGLQMREKQLTDRGAYELVDKTVALALGRIVLVNSRADIAMATGASGVHLPAAGMPIASLRRRWGHRLVIGRSTHHLDEIRQAAKDGADYVTFGPIFDTPSKRRFGDPQGLEALREAVAVGLPVLALGGVGAESMAALAAAGAHGIAGIRAFKNTESLVEMARLGQRLWPE